MSQSTLEALPQDQFSILHARHLLLRAGFGGNWQQIQAIHNMGLPKAVQYLVDYQQVPDTMPAWEGDPNIKRKFTREERAMIAKAKKEKDESIRGYLRARRNAATAEDRNQYNRLKVWWLKRMILSPRPLEEKLTLLWHGHFASRQDNVEDSWLMHQQQQLFRKHANGNFKDLLHGIIRDPAMIVFLNNDKNIKRRPNENLAREIMELFALGIGNYTEKDIKEGARALTGYHRNDNVFFLRKPVHDTGKKTILGQTGNWNGEDFVRILLEQEACPKFIGFKLYKHFIDDPANPITKDQQAIIDGLAQTIRQHDYEMKPVLTQLFMSQHFYSPEVVGAKISGPAEITASMVRAIQPPARNNEIISEAIEVMGQELFNPPSVAGWPAGKAWINTSTLFMRQNLATYLITGKLTSKDNWTTERINYDPSVIYSDLKDPTPEQIIDRFFQVFLGSKATEERRQQLLTFFKSHDNRTDTPVVLGALCLVTATPEAQLI